MTDLQNEELFMRRCLQLARLGEAAVAPNPMVGAVLVYEGLVIGEGWHRAYGGPHAEVNCIASVAAADRELIAKSTMYVSLEPCAHWGKTPPCTDLIIREGVPRVVIGCRDPFRAVNGKGIEKLKAAGVEVITGVLEEECKALNESFLIAHTLKRPFITLKWAQSADGFIAGREGKRVAISNTQSARVVHKLRATHAGILVGTNTALFDDPVLSTRHWPGPSPVRIVLDRLLRLPASLQLFNGEQRTIVFNELRTEAHHNLEYQQLPVRDEVSMLRHMLTFLYQNGIHSLLVEGGAHLLQQFIDGAIWDATLRITATRSQLGKGIAAPLLHGGIYTASGNLDGDLHEHYRNPARLG